MTRDVAKRTGPADPTADMEYATKQYVDDERAKVSSNDTTPGYLLGKLVAGTGISLTEGNDGGDETLEVAADGNAGLPFSEVLNTLVFLGNIGPMKFGFWGGVVGNDVVTVIPDGDNDVNQCLTCMSIVFTSMPSPNGYPHVAADVFEQFGHPTGPDSYWDSIPANLVPNGHAHAIISVPDKVYIGQIQGEVQINVTEDGEAVLYRTEGSSEFYIGLFLMWI